MSCSWYEWFSWSFDGLANQEVVKWIMEMQQELKQKHLSKSEIEAYVRKTLDEGKVSAWIWSCCFAQKTDPRYEAQMILHAGIFRMIRWFRSFGMFMRWWPPILQSLGKVKNSPGPC